MTEAIHWSQLRIVTAFKQAVGGAVVPTVVKAVALDTPEGETPLSELELSGILAEIGVSPLVVGGTAEQFIETHFAHDLPVAPVPRSIELTSRLRPFVAKLVPIVGRYPLATILEGIVAELLDHKDRRRGTAQT